jgi:hypothetical protein
MGMSGKALIRMAGTSDRVNKHRLPMASSNLPNVFLVWDVAKGPGFPAPEAMAIIVSPGRILKA